MLGAVLCAAQSLGAALCAAQCVLCSVCCVQCCVLCRVWVQRCVLCSDVCVLSCVLCRLAEVGNDLVNLFGLGSAEFLYPNGPPKQTTAPLPKMKLSAEDCEDFADFNSQVATTAS